MAVPVIESQAVGSSATTTSTATASKPTGTASGDVLLAFVCVPDKGALPVTGPAGWTKLVENISSFSSNEGLSVWYILAGGSEPSSYSWTLNAARRYIVNIFRISGADATTPINVSGGAINPAGDLVGVSNPAAPSVTTTVADCLLLCAAVSDTGDITYTAPSGMSLAWQQNQSNSGLNRVSAAVASETISSSGATGTRTFTPSTTSYWAAASIAIAPAAGGGPTDYPITAGAGSYTLTGTAATLKVGRKVAAASGSYALTGTAATLKLGKTIAAAAGSYSLTGQPATLRRTRLLGAGSGSYALSGTAATLKATKLVAANGGTYTLTGTAATLRAGRVVAAAAGAYTLTGQPATLTAGVNYTLGADAGAYVVTGSTATFVATRVLAGEAGSYSLTGQDAGLSLPRSVRGGDDAPRRRPIVFEERRREPEEKPKPKKVRRKVTKALVKEVIESGTVPDAPDWWKQEPAIVQKSLPVSVWIPREDKDDREAVLESIRRYLIAKAEEEQDEEDVMLLLMAS